MKTKVSEQLLREVSEWKLRFACEHCANFLEDSEACVEGYPTTEHRIARLADDQIVFCKLFEYEGN